MQSEMKEEVVCFYCGHIGDKLQPPYLSCCPERGPLNVHQWREEYQKLSIKYYRLKYGKDPQYIRWLESNIQRLTKAADINKEDVA